MNYKDGRETRQAMSSDEDEGDGRRATAAASPTMRATSREPMTDAWNDSRKRRRGQTKEQAIYGIFGDDSDRRTTATIAGAPVDYGPVNFKSAGGTGGGGAGLGAGKEPEDMFAADDEDAPPTAGLGARGSIGSSAGLRFASQGGAGLGFRGSPRVTRSPRRWRTTRRRRGRRAEGWAPPLASALPALASAARAFGFAPASSGDGGEDGPAAGAFSTPWTSTNTTATTRISSQHVRTEVRTARPPDFFPRPSSNSTDTAD